MRDMATGHLGGGLALDAKAAERVAALVVRLAAYRAAYDNERPTISDAAYDALEDELRALDPANPFLARVGSPVAADAWEKARHEIPMGSLNKATNPDELRTWLTRCDELLAKENMDAIGGDLYMTEKLDGISIELIYRDGQLEDGITRGDGEMGERITSNVVRMRGIPHRIPHKHRLSVRGEIILRISDYEAHFRAAGYGSPRNTAAGAARRLDGATAKHLTIVSYDLAGELDLSTEVEKFEVLAKLGFATPNSFKGDFDFMLGVFDDYASSRRAALDYEIDGLVLRANQLVAQAALGELNRRPRAAVAFKFASVGKATTIRSITWETGPSGRVTPLAAFDAVELVGAMVKRASLHNMANVRAKGFGVGDEVLVKRRNDVIPYVEEIIVDGGRTEQPPERCAVCEQPLVIEGEYLLCTHRNCEALLQGRIKNWIKAVGALEWGDKLIATLVDKELVREPLDLYRLTVEDIAGLERHGDKSAQNALEQLHGRLPLRLDTFLTALGIPGFAARTATLVVKAGYDELDKLAAATTEELAALDGLGAIKAQNIVDGLSARADEITRLLQHGIQPVSRDAAGPLAGKTFCITGSHSRSRKELEVLITDAGGQMLSGVSKELDYLVIADPSSTSSKAKKALRYGTELLDEERLLAEISGDA